MKSWQLRNSGQGPELVAGETPRPRPGEGEVLIRVLAAGVTPSELGWYPTTHTKTGEARLAPVPSHEFAGEVVEAGPGVPPGLLGQTVFGMNDWFADGALAEFCVTRPEWIAPLPDSLTAAQAAATPISVLTAWQGLLVRAGLLAGERVLVHGAGGAVGIFAVQLARAQGALVIATASSSSAAFVKELGASEVVDYQTTRFESVVHDVDVVFDTVGGETLARSWQVLSARGRLVTIASDSEAVADARVKDSFFIVEPNREQLMEAKRLIDRGKLRVFAREIPFSQAADAYFNRLPRRGRGKASVIVADQGVPLTTKI